jgi:tetratricopeptide (TPR) repeat protein
MKLITIPFLGLVLAMSPVYAIQTADELYVQAIKALKDPSSNDNSAFNRLLIAALEQDPDHPKAMWMLLSSRLGLFSYDIQMISARAEKLVNAAQGIKIIIENAKQRNEYAFAQYVLARYRGLYNDFDLALDSINQALEKEPGSIRYLYTKGIILIDKGKWKRNDSFTIEGMQAIDQARKMAEINPSMYFNMENYYFKLAYTNSMMIEKNPEKTVEYYLGYLKYSTNKGDIARAWNNISIAYKNLGQCKKAGEAAKKALEIMDFGAARSNLRYSQFCQKMEKMELLHY